MVEIQLLLEATVHPANRQRWSERVAKNRVGLLLLTLAAGSMLVACVAQAQTATAIGFVAHSSGAAAPPSDAFSESLSISGTTIVAGDQTDPNQSGDTYMFSQSGNGWASTGSETSASGFGFDVAASGQNVAVGTLESGLVYVYTQAHHKWQLVRTLRSPDPSDQYFGDSVAMSGPTLVASGFTEHHGAGRVYVFTDGVNGWQKTATLKASDSRRGANFGSSIAVSGSSIAVSSQDRHGRVYVFSDTARGWTQEAELGGSMPQNLQFGSAISLSGNKLAVGALGSKSTPGRVYIYTNGSTGWHLTAQLKSPEGAVNEFGGDQFGGDVGISGSTVVVGANQSEGLRGQAYVFADGTRGWKEVADLNPSDTVPNSNFGAAVGISGGTLVVGTDGTPGCSEKIGNGPSQSTPCIPPWTGGAYVYSNNGSGWRLITKLVRPQ